MHKSLFILILGLVFQMSGASATSPEQSIQNMFMIAKEKDLNDQKVIDELDSYFDFHQLSLNILGDEVFKKNAEDIKWFEESIKEIITKSIYPKATDFLGKLKVEYGKTLIDKNRAIVKSKVSKKGEKSDVNYMLINTPVGWKVIDIVIDEDSWVENMNKKISKSIKEKGWPGVKEILNKRLNELSFKNIKKKNQK